MSNEPENETVRDPDEPSAHRPPTVASYDESAYDESTYAPTEAREPGFRTDDENSRVDIDTLKE